MTEERKMLNVEKNILHEVINRQKSAVWSERPIKRRVLSKRTGQAWVRNEVKCVLMLVKENDQNVLEFGLSFERDLVA